MRGESLLETVVYVAIIGVIAVLTTGAVLSVYKAYGKTTVERKLATSGEVAMERMIREVRAATSTDMAVSVFKTNPGILKVGGKKFLISSNVLRVDEGSGPVNLTESDIKVTNLIFYHATSTKSEIVVINMTLQGGAGLFSESKNFSASAVLRGAY